MQEAKNFIIALKQMKLNVNKTFDQIWSVQFSQLFEELLVEFLRLFSCHWLVKVEFVPLKNGMQRELKYENKTTLANKVKHIEMNVIQLWHFEYMLICSKLSNEQLFNRMQV